MNCTYAVIIITLSAIFTAVIGHAILTLPKAHHSIRCVAHDCGIECVLRGIIRKNPSADIIVLNKSHSADTHKLLRIMKRDFPQINII